MRPATEVADWWLNAFLGYIPVESRYNWKKKDIPGALRVLDMVLGHGEKQAAWDKYRAEERAALRDRGKSKQGKKPRKRPEDD
jgi:hypothetical protein